jgi:serine-type D-Ala-D-Ala carboxypeptidase (penicillin-binding protein 5/6)
VAQRIECGFRDRMRPQSLTRRGRGVLTALLSAALSVGAASSHATAATEQQPPPLSATAFYLVDARDGTRLAGQDAGTRAAIASTTKLMTAYVARDELPLSERLVAPPYDPLPGESLLGLETGERISVRDLLYGLLLPSGNDAAVALAQGAAGSVPAFVAEMNRAAGRLGLKDTSFANPIGLDEASNYSTPRDLARLTMRLRREGLFRRIFDTPRTTLQTGARPRTIVNHNDLVLTVPWIDGVKTGYTLDAGYVLIGSGTRKGVTLLSVVLGTPSEAARQQDTLSLLDYGFSLYVRRTPVRSGETLAAPAVRGRDQTLPLVAAESVRVSARRGQSIRVAVDAPDEVQGPIPRGRRLGTGVVTLDGEVIGRVALLSKRPALGPAGSSVASWVDDAVPAVAWAAIGAAVVAIVIGIALTRRRRRGQPGQGAQQ